MHRLRFTLLLALLGCTSARAPGHPTRAADKSPLALRVSESASLQKLLHDQGALGVIAVLRGEDSQIACSDPALCQKRVLPASTFKIPNALIGLETGVIADADFVIPWDGVTRDLPAWNRDHTLRSAIQVSAVPYFQELARRVGPAREAEWVRALSYGNADSGSQAAVDRFWLDGPLAISPVEQLDFLRRFATGKLPVSTRSREIVRDILVLDHHADTTLRGKTGWGHPHQPDQVGWFVGYVERQDQRTYFAVLLYGQPEQDDDTFLATRRKLAERALTELGVW